MSVNEPRSSSARKRSVIMWSFTVFTVSWCPKDTHRHLSHPVFRRPLFHLNRPIFSLPVLSCVWRHATGCHSCALPPEEGLSACTMNKCGTTPITFSLFSLVCVTSLTSPLQFFISHFTLHVDPPHCMSPPRGMGGAGEMEVVKEAIYSIWLYTRLCVRACVRARGSLKVRKWRVHF